MGENEEKKCLFDTCQTVSGTALTFEQAGVDIGKPEREDCLDQSWSQSRQLKEGEGHKSDSQSLMERSLILLAHRRGN